MIRCTLELLLGGNEEGRRVIGCIEIANIGVDAQNRGSYAVVLKKCPPFAGALRQAWRKGQVKADLADQLNRAVAGEDDEAIVAEIGGHHRTRRGVYDLLYRALRACGLEERNPR